MLRRVALTSVGLSMAIVSVLGSPASASGRLIVKTGQQWTLEVDNGGGCEIEQIGTHHTWTDIHFPNDSGTYTGGRSKVTLTFSGKSEVFTGDWFSSNDEYIGLDNSDIAQLVEGAVSTWDGVPC
jgi:hypothetical protein